MNSKLDVLYSPNNTFFVRVFSAISKNIWLIFAIAIGLAAYIRLFFSIDVTDETIYLALPYGFSLGYLPFFQESALYQGSGVLLTPIVSLYKWIVGGPDGLMLFFRQLYFASSLLLAYNYYKAMKNHCPVSMAQLCAVFFICFVPYSIPSLSYNTLTGFLFCLSCLLSYKATQTDHVKKILLTFSIVLLGAAVFSYPSILAVTPFWPVMVFLGTKKESRHQLWMPFTVGALICFAAAGSVIAIVGSTRLMEMLDFQLAFNIQTGGIDKVLFLFQTFRAKVALGLVLLVVPVLSLYDIWKNKTVRYIIYRATPAALIVFYYLIHNSSSKSHDFIEQLAFVAVILTFTRSALIPRNIRYFLVYLPALAGAAVSYTSSSANFSGGCFFVLPAAVCIPLMYMSWKDSFRPVRFLNVLSLTLAILICMGFYNYVYRDDDVAYLNTSVSFGAFKYIQTEEPKKRFLETVERDLRSHIPKAAKTIMFFDNFPGGYLMTDLKPLTNALLLTARKHYKYNREIFAGFFRKPENQPDIAIQMKYIVIFSDHAYDFTGDPEDPVNALFNQAPYQKYFENAYFIMHVKNSVPR